MMSVSLSNNAILNINSADYCCSLTRINKSEAMNLMESISLSETLSGTL